MDHTNLAVTESYRDHRVSIDGTRSGNARTSTLVLPPVVRGQTVRGQTVLEELRRVYETETRKAEEEEPRSPARVKPRVMTCAGYFLSHFLKR